jgi:hypothetical protein
MEGIGVTFMMYIQDCVSKFLAVGIPLISTLMRPLRLIILALTETTGMQAPTAVFLDGAITLSTAQTPKVMILRGMQASMDVSLIAKTD